MHRAGNVDDPDRLRALAALLAALPGPVVLPLHPRTRARLSDAGLLGELGQIEGLTLTEPLGYAQFSALLCQARAILTDSGGVQKEAYLAGVPCVTLRASTEWVETVDSGWNTLVDLDAQAALDALAKPPPRERPALYGDGNAAQRCVQAIDSLAALEPWGENEFERRAHALRVGVVGLGYWGPNLARNFAAIPGCELRWICDPRREAREAVAPPSRGRSRRPRCGPARGPRARRGRAGHAGADARAPCDERRAGRQALLRREAARDERRRRRARGRRGGARAARS